MAKEFSRSQRVAEQIRRDLADLLQFEVKAPRFDRVTVTEVEVTVDMSNAKIYYSAPPAAQDTGELQKGLEKSAGFLRGQLAKRMMLRTVPQLHFIYDASIDRGMRLSQLIDEALAPDQRPSEE